MSEQLLRNPEIETASEVALARSLSAETTELLPLLPYLLGDFGNSEATPK